MTTLHTSGAPRRRDGDPARERRPARHRPRAVHRRPGQPAPRRAPRPPGAGPAHPCPGDGTAHRAGAAGARRRPGAHRRGRAGSQRRRGQARRAAVPGRGDVRGPRRVLGARRVAGGGPTGRPGRRGRLRAAARAGHDRRGDRGGELPGRPPDAAARRPGGRVGRLRARRRGRVRVRRPGALLPGDQRRARHDRRERAGLRPVVDAAPERDPGDHRARPGPDELRGHGAVPADGRRLRRQGDAAARLRGDRRARRPRHRAAGAAAAEPDAGHDDDRQAARVPRDVEGRVRRRRADPGADRDADRRRRLEPRPVRAGAGPGALPHRQRLLDPEHRGARAHLEDEQDVPDRVPRLRRAPGHAGDRGHPRPVRARARDQCPRAAPAQLLPSGPDDAVRAAGAPPGAAGAALVAGPRVRRRRPAAGRDRGVQRRARAHQAGAGDHPGQVRDLVQPDGVQPGRRPGARLQGRLDR